MVKDTLSVRPVKHERKTTYIVGDKYWERHPFYPLQWDETATLPERKRIPTSIF